MNIALVLAGGIGSRMEQQTPKQYLPLDEKPMLVHSLQAFSKHPQIDAITIVCHPNWQADIQAWLKKYQIHKVSTFQEGGPTRRESSYLGLQSIQSYAPAESIVLIHDAARPFVSEEIITNNIQTVQQYGASCTVTTASDTIFVSENHLTIDSIPERDQLYLSQTPQSFYLHQIYAAHKHFIETKATFTVTDDCSIALHYGLDVALTEGNQLNGKVTTATDFAMLEWLKKHHRK